MSSVVQLDPPPAEVSPTHRRLRLFSRLLSWLFTGLLAAGGLVAAVLVAGILVYPGDDYRIGSDAVWIGTGSPDSVPFHSLSLPHRLAYVLVGIARTAPTLLIFWHMRELFRLYAGGTVFAPQNARHLGRAGAWLCAYALAPLACHLFLQATGYEIDRNWMHLGSVQAFVLGLMVFVIAQVMRVGREIEEDRDGFV